MTIETKPFKRGKSRIKPLTRLIIQHKRDTAYRIGLLNLQLKLIDQYK